MEVIIEENPCGGKGKMKLEKLLAPAEMKDKCGLYARVTLPPGAVLGYHEHHGNTETYHILQGEALYSDNGKEMKIGVGTTTFCPDGEGHSIENCGTEDLVFIALITKSL